MPRAEECSGEERESQDPQGDPDDRPDIHSGECTAASTRHNEATRDAEVRLMAKAKDKGGDKNVKRAAQKSIKEKRAAKKAKKQASRSSA